MGGSGLSALKAFHTPAPVFRVKKGSLNRGTLH